MENAEFYKKLWKLQIPSKGKGFIWKLSHKRLPSKDNLQRRNILAGGSDTVYSAIWGWKLQIIYFLNVSLPMKSMILMGR